MLQDASELDVVKVAAFDWRLSVHLVHLANDSSRIGSRRAAKLALIVAQIYLSVCDTA